MTPLTCSVSAVLNVDGATEAHRRAQTSHISIVPDDELEVARALPRRAHRRIASPIQFFALACRSFRGAGPLPFNNSVSPNFHSWHKPPTSCFSIQSRYFWRFPALLRVPNDGHQTVLLPYLATSFFTNRAVAATISNHHQLLFFVQRLFLAPYFYRWFVPTTVPALRS